MTPLVERPAQPTRSPLLIGDDDPRSGALFGQLPRGNGYDTEVEPSGIAAVDRLGHGPILETTIPDFASLVSRLHAAGPVLA